MARPRLVPDLPLPATAYCPGHGARPAGEADAAEPAPGADDWHRSRGYLRGLDLFNHGFPWEAHEVWEGLWHDARRRPERRREAAMLRGLIQLAAVRVLVRDGRGRGAERVAERARKNLSEAGPGPVLGLDPVELTALAARLLAGETEPALSPR